MFGAVARMFATPDLNAWLAVTDIDPASIVQVVSCDGSSRAAWMEHRN